MQFILLEKYYSLERENENLKLKVQNLEAEIKALKESIELFKNKKNEISVEKSENQLK